MILYLYVLQVEDFEHLGQSTKRVYGKVGRLISLPPYLACRRKRNQLRTLLKAMQCPYCESVDMTFEYGEIEDEVPPRIAYLHCQDCGAEYAVLYGEDGGQFILSGGWKSTQYQAQGEKL
jgi:hypothetical protein